MYKEAWSRTWPLQIAIPEASQVVSNHPLGGVQSSRVRYIPRCLEHDWPMGWHLNSKTLKILCWPKGKDAYEMNGASQPPTCEPVLLKALLFSPRCFKNTWGRWEGDEQRTNSFQNFGSGGGSEGSCWFSMCRAPDVATGH